MSEIIASGIIEARRLEAFAETFASKPPGAKTPLIHEIKLHFDRDGFHVTAVDPANITMVGPTTFHARGFDHYEAPGQAVVGVDLRTLLERISRADSDQLIEFQIDMETRNMDLSYGPADLSMSLIDHESVRVEPDVPDLDLPNTFTVTGETLSESISFADMVSEQLTIEGRPDERELVIDAEGDTDDVTVTYDDEDEELLDARIGEDAETIISLAYMKHVAKPIPDDSEVTVSFGDEFPVILEWEAFDGAFEVRQTVAPRIDTTQ